MIVDSSPHNIPTSQSSVVPIFFDYVHTMWHILFEGNNIMNIILLTITRYLWYLIALPLLLSSLIKYAKWLLLNWMVPLKLKYYIFAWYVWMHDFINNRIKNSRILFIESCNGQKSQIKKANVSVHFRSNESFRPLHLNCEIKQFNAMVQNFVANTAVRL